MATFQSSFYLTSQQHFTKLTTSLWNRSPVIFLTPRFPSFPSTPWGFLLSLLCHPDCFSTQSPFFIHFKICIILCYIILFYFFSSFEVESTNLYLALQSRRHGGYDSAFFCLLHVLGFRKYVYMEWSQIYIYLFFKPVFELQTLITGHLTFPLRCFIGMSKCVPTNLSSFLPSPFEPFLPQAHCYFLHLNVTLNLCTWRMPIFSWVST